jgi:mannosyltransferase
MMAVDTLRPQTPTPSSEVPARTPATGFIEKLRGREISGWVVAGLVLALTLISLALRVGDLHFRYWIDEALSVGISSHPLNELPTLLREDGSPPLYYLMLHGWMALWGRGEVATHTLSLIFAVLTVPVAYWGGSSLFGRRVGAYCAVLAAGLPFLTEYAQETRMYSLLALLSLIVTVSLVHVFVYRRRRYLPVFALSLTAALYTHNWALFLGLATFLSFLYSVWAQPASRRPLLIDGAIGFGVVALLYLPWLPTLLYQAQHTGAPWALAPVVWSLSTGLYFLVGGRGAAVALLLAAGSGLVTLRATRQLERPTVTASVALAMLGLGTLLIAWMYAKFTPAWSGRYLAVIVGPLLVLVALGLVRARGLGLAAVALVCCFWVLDPTPSSPLFKSNVASVASAMRPHTRPTTLVLSTQPEQVPTLAYYLPRLTHFATPLGAVPDPGVVDWRNALNRFEHSSVRAVLAPMIGALTPGQRVLLVVPASSQKTPKWMALIHRTSKRWTSYLAHDRRLRLIEASSSHLYSSNLPVRAWLFAVRGR